MLWRNRRIATPLPAADLDADPFPLMKCGQRWLAHAPAPSSLAHSWHTAHGTLEIWYVHQLAQHPLGQPHSETVPRRPPPVCSSVCRLPLPLRCCFASSMHIACHRHDMCRVSTFSHQPHPFGEAVCRRLLLTLQLLLHTAALAPAANCLAFGTLPRGLLRPTAGLARHCQWP